MEIATPSDEGGPVLALIPARGGSKSVPRKNLLLLAGKPLIAYSITDALAASRIHRVIVSTDDDEIAHVGRQYGAEVPFLRPQAISGDLAQDIEFHIHALEWLRDHEGYTPGLVVNLRPTHPVRRCETIDRAIAALAAAPEADSLRSVRLATHSPFKMWTIEAGYLAPVATLQGVPEPYNMPRQLLPLAYWQDGYIDISRPSVILSGRSTTGARILPFLIHEKCIDIDYADQIDAAEKLIADRVVSDLKPSLETGTRHPS